MSTEIDTQTATPGRLEGPSFIGLINHEFSVDRGHPNPLGVTLDRGGVNFAVYSRHSTSIALVIFLTDHDEPLAEFPLDPRFNRTGDVWHVLIRGLHPGIEYGWRVDGPSFHEDPRLRFDRTQVLIDPYARALSEQRWGESRICIGSETRGSKRRACVVANEFDWGQDQPLNRHLADSVIYELHVRGFTKDPTSDVESPGTFLGLVEKIPYLKELGVTAVELLPVTEFDETDNGRHDPNTGNKLCNFWGYHPINFFAVKGSYSSGSGGQTAVDEFKTMVKALHAVGIEVILDIVFNHTAEGSEQGPTLNFRGLDNDVYYIVDQRTGEYHNYSGCGNTLNCNHPNVRDMILEALRYWVTEMHVDGFRFDLASILGRGRDGSVLANPPLLERIAADPILAATKLIAEAWDAAGLYQVGSFPNWGRWAEWNGKFRDNARAFVKGDAGLTSALATRLCGSPDLYAGGDRAPYHSINFTTCHDGFTMRDLVSYNEKHNLANGEGNRDGDNHNLSWNCGAEGETSDERILVIRRQQIKNHAAILLLSRGVPMILSGDEMGRTQAGNNNAYCQDNELNWINWDQVHENADLFRFFKEMIRFRMTHPILRKRTFDSAETHTSIDWHGVRLRKPDWSCWSRAIAMHLRGFLAEDDIYVSCNAHWETLTFELPKATRGRRWLRFADTSLPTPEDIHEPGKEVELKQQREYSLASRSVVVLVAR
jgi:isoamylase